VTTRATDKSPLIERFNDVATIDDLTKLNRIPK